MRVVNSNAYALSILMYFFTAVFSQSMNEIRRLPCQFIDERVEVVEEVILGKKMNLTETKFHHRDAVLQFGQPGGSPLQEDLITFLVSGE